MDTRSPVVKLSDLPATSIGRELVGAEHGLDVTVIFVEAPPGRGPALHRHPYAELFVVQEGEATFMVDGESLHAGAGDIVVARANQAHSFVNSGAGVLRQIDIHLSASFSTEWLDELSRS